MQGLAVYGRGTQVMTLDELRTVETPPATETWTPVSHHSLATSIRTISQDLLKGYSLAEEQYGVARNAQQLFAVLTFRSDNSEMGLSIGFRNSLDKSMAIGLAIGSQVFVCSNLMMTGDIAIMRKHTPNIIATLEDLAISTLYKAQYTFAKLVRDAQALKAHGLDDRQAFQLIGVLFGNGILSPRQLPVALEQWKKPQHQEFAPRNAFSLYNGITEALKTSPPLSVMERHINAHEILLKEVNGTWL